jgi:serine/threonine protein kinase
LSAEALDPENMEIMKAAQCFEMNGSSPQFLYTKVICRLENKLYCSRTARRIPTRSRNIDPQSLTNTTLIPIDAYSPRFTAGMTRAPSPLPPNTYIKQPNLLAYDAELRPDLHMLQDIEACEILKRHPHENLATYYGCEVSNDGRVVGLCFEAYQQTLMEMVNPGHLSKHHPPDCSSTAADNYISAIRNGIHHIHSLNLAHNDLNPSNIMFDAHDKPVIIDFDSCLPFDSCVSTAKRTHGWFNPEIKISDPQNDWDALSEMHAWLHGTTEKYKFS